MSSTLFWIIVAILAFSLFYCLSLVDKMMLRIDYLESCISVISKQVNLRGDSDDTKSN